MHVKNLINKQFRYLTSLEVVGKTLSGNNIWKCLCVCQKFIEYPETTLLKSGVASCGCKTHVDISIDARFGNLLILSKIENILNKEIWKCKCDCGKIVNKSSKTLKIGTSTSCGCMDISHQSGSKGPKWRGCGEISLFHFSCYVRGAYDRNLEFNITIEEVWNLFLKQNRKCALSGVDLVFAKTSKTKSTGTASLDRIDNKKGYTLDNIQWVHKDINYLKQDYDEKYFIEMCKNVTVNQQIEK